MPVLPNGEWVDDEEYAQRQFQALAAQTVPMSGTVLGTNYSFTPTPKNVGLNLGWDAAPDLSAGFTFDPSVSSSNAFLSDYDVSASGMADVLGANLGVKTGLEGTGFFNDANPYAQGSINTGGLNLSTGTNIPSSATFSAGNLEDQGYSLDLSKVSGGPTQATFTKEISPGVTANISTDPSKNNPTGLKFESSWDDAGKMLRQFLGAINPISDAGADASVPEIAVAPSMQGVDYSQALADVGMAAVPMVDVTDQLSYNMRYPGIPGPVSTIGEATEGMGGQEKRDMEDAVHHLDAVYGGVTPGLPQAFQQGNTATNLLDNATRFAQKWGLGAITTVLGNSGNVPADMLNDYLESLLDKRDPIGDGLDKSTSEIQDLINNRVFMDARKSGISKDQMLDSILNQTNTLVALDTSDTGPLAAAAELSQEHGIPLTEDKINEMAFQVDTFKDIPAAPAKPAGPTKAELQAAAAAQRKADEEARKAAARRTELARQALKDSQAAAAKAQAASEKQAKAAQARAKAVLAAAAGRDRGGPSQAEINAAIEVMSQVDTFGGGSIGFDGGGFDPQGGETGSSGMGAWT